jgi:nitrogen-specific signal transduction histidine kinase
MAMEGEERFRDIEQAFVATFQHELIPGILHNFANLLNGIMGRAQILKKRIEVNQKKIQDQYPDIASDFSDINEKILSDITSITTESDRFYNMFHDVSGKFYTLGQKREEKINISRLIASELRFADYYLDFKHEVAKEITIDDSLPDINGIYSYVSIALWMLFRHAMKRMKAEQDKILFLSVTCDQNHVIISCRFGGVIYSDHEISLIASVAEKEDLGNIQSQMNEDILLSVALMKEMGMLVEAARHEGCNEIIIRMAY